MAGTLKLTDIAHSSGAGTITVDSLATLAISTGKLTVGGIAIETGAHTTAVSAVNPLTITSGNITGKSNYTVSYNASSGTSTAFVVNLPAPTDFATTVISVVSSTAHGLGNSIIIKDSAGTEVYTLYHKGDYCTFVSDGTNTLRTGNEFATIRSEIALTANVSVATTAVLDVFNSATATNYTVVDNIGSGWNSTTHDFIAPHAGLYRFGGHGAVETARYISVWLLKKNSAWVTYIATLTNAATGKGNLNEFPMSLAKNDSIEFWASNHSTAGYVTGAASATSERAFANAWMLRRY
jgi:hypothetical protein